MKSVWKAAIALLVVACGGDGGITNPSERDALLSSPTPLAIGVDPTTGATIETNKDDYLPGEVVHLNGRGWAPGESINLHMTEAPDTHADVDTNVVADSLGEFSVHFYDVQPHDFGVRFTLTATGQKSGSVAVASFTDGNAAVDIAPSYYPGVATTRRFSVLVRNTSTTASCLKVTVPAGYSGVSATGTSAQGWTTIGVSGNVITFTGTPALDATTLNWARVEVTATTPVSATANWVAALYTNTACTSDENKRDAAILVGAANNFPYTADFRDVGGAVVVSETGVAGTPKLFRLRLTNTSTAGSGADAVYGVIALPPCFASPTVAAGGVTSNGSDASWDHEIRDNVIRVFNGKLDKGQTDHVQVAFTTTPQAGCTPIFHTGLWKSAEHTSSVGDMFTGAAHPSITLPAASINTTTLVAAVPTPSTFGQSVTFTATVTPVSGPAAQGTVNFYEFPGAQTCTALGGVLAIGTDITYADGFTFAISSLSVGSHTITACYVPNTGWNQSGNSTSHVVNLANQTITFNAPGPFTFGDSPFNVVASATSGLAVSFASQTPSVCSVTSATNTAPVTILTAGTCTIRASQAGDANYNAAPNVDRNITINLANQTITFNAPGPFSFGDSPFTVSATATSGLTVTFGSQTPATCTVSGTTVTIIAAGTCTIRASQAGNGNYNAATNEDRDVTISTTGQTITFVAPGPYTFGDPAFTVSATATSGLTVAFTSLTLTKCTVSGTTVTIVAAGTCTIRASQPGNSSYNAAPDVDRNITINQADQTITFNAPGPFTFGDPPFTVSATATSGLAVTFTSQTVAKCTVSGTTVTIVATGTCTIRASQTGNGNYNAAPNVDENITIGLGDQTITFNAPGPFTFGAPPFTVSATATSGLAVSFSSQTLTKCTVSGTTVTILGTGTCTIRASQGGNSNYNPAANVDEDITINQANQTITFNAPGPYTYGDAPFTVTATATSGLTVTFASQTLTTCTVSGTTVTIVGAGTCTIRASQAGDANYNPAPNVDRNISIAKATISSTPAVSPTTQQYSDKITPRTVLAAQTGALPSGVTLTGTVTFKLGATTIGAEDVSVTSLSATITEATAHALTVLEGSYSVTAVFVPTGTSADNFAAGTSGSAALTVTPEDANIVPDAANVYAYSTSTNTNFSLQFNISENGTTEDNFGTAANWAVGNINLEPIANITAKLNPVTVGSVETGNCSQVSAATAGYNMPRRIRCDFTTVVPDAYEVVFTVGTASPTTDDYYAGVWDKGIVAVIDPNAALPSGGGWIPMENSVLNFGLNYSLSGPKNNKTVRGGMVAIRHYTSGPNAGWVCRIKTNTLNAPSTTAALAGSPSPGWYSVFSGTNVSYNCKDAAGVVQESAGNQSLAGYVEDRGEPGRNDKFWLKVTGRINMTLPGSSNAVPLGGGNLQVPKP